MPYYAYVGDEPTMGLASVDQVKQFIENHHGDKKGEFVQIFDMTWTREGQKLIESYVIGEQKT